MKTEEDYKTEEQNVCACCRHKHTPRPEQEQKKLQNRVNRIIGQMNGIKAMIDDNRYCGDILIQIGAVVRKGNQQIMAEVVELIRKM